MPDLYIPISSTDEVVRLSLDHLPHDASDILDILQAEQAPLDLWLIIAREYFKQGNIKQFLQVLEEGTSTEVDEFYANVTYERIAILNTLGAYHSYLGKTETKQKEKDDHFIQATKYYNKASRIDVHEPSTWVGKGQLLLAKGELEQASGAFRVVLDGDGNNVPALLGQACVQFNRGRYLESLDLYKRALIAYPNCPASVRLGIGVCRYKLGQFEKARQAFQRVLQLDPENIEALVALGVMDLQTKEADGIRNGMEKMQKAFEIYPYCAMALNYLANHFFFTGQHFLVEQLSEAALAASNDGRLKSHSYYNLARSYHSKGDYEKAGRFYMASVNESSKPHDFVLPYYGLGQVKLKLGDFRGSLLNFEKVLEVYPENCESLKVVGHIHVQLGQTEKALEVLRKASRIDARDAQVFLELGQLLMPSDTGAALDAFTTARSLLKNNGEEATIELLNNIGVLHFERGEFELAEQTFKETLGAGVWDTLMEGRKWSPFVDSESSMEIFRQLEEEGTRTDLHWDKVTTLYNYARLLEQIHDSDKASILYRLIAFKYPNYQDAYLRLAAIAKARNNIQLSIELTKEALKVNEKSQDALSILGSLELKSGDWVKAKETLVAARNAANGKDSYAALSLGNWNYFAAVRAKRRDSKLEATHLEKAKEIYTKVLTEHTSNLYAANGAAVVLAEKGQFDVSKDLFTQVQEAGSGSVFVQMPDVWMNLAHVYFAQGQFALAVKMYQNCLRKFHHDTDTEILHYLARTHYEAEQWQDCKKTLLRAIHLAPSNYTLRFDAGVAMEKFSASILQRTKRTADEVRSTVSELKNAVRLFSQLSAVSKTSIHVFDEKKINTHVAYCEKILEDAKVHCAAAEQEEQQNRQRLEVARQVTLAEEALRKAEEQRKYQLEKRKQEEEIKQVRQQEENFNRVKETWKSTPAVAKRKERSHAEDEEGGGKRKRKGGKRRKKEKKTFHYDLEDEAEPNSNMNDDNGMSDYHEEDQNQQAEENLLAAAGLEDSDVEEDIDEPSAVNRRRRGWSESDEEEATDLKQVEAASEMREETEELIKDVLGEDED
ncbi:Protein CTR9 [Ranunculus cassubicifolius]